MFRLFHKSSGLWNRNVALSGMAPVTVNRGPGDAAVMTFSAEVALNDLDHINVVCALPHLKNGWMADFAFEPDSMKPVGKNDRRHSGLFGIAIHGNITVFGLGNRRNVKSEEKSDNQNR